VGRLKSVTTGRYIAGVRSERWPRFAGRLWQRNCYEHTVRNDRDLKAIREYVTDGCIADGCIADGYIADGHIAVDILVYELYDLSAEEIRIVAEGTKCSQVRWGPSPGGADRLSAPLQRHGQPVCIYAAQRGRHLCSHAGRSSPPVASWTMHCAPRGRYPTPRLATPALSSASKGGDA
jgi:hypothetical protein